MKKSSTQLQFVAKPLSQFQLTSCNNSGRRFILFIILVFMATAGFAQAPNISYHTPNVFDMDTSIAPLAPGNTGGPIPTPTRVQIISNFQMPGNITLSTFAVDAAGNIYVPNRADDTPNSMRNNVLKFPAGGGTPVPLGAGIDFPVAVALDAAGNVYVSDYRVGEIWEIPVGGGARTVVGTGLSHPDCLAVDAAGNIYVADYGHDAVVKFTTGSSTPVVVASAPNLQPTGIALDASNNIYVVNGKNMYEIQADNASLDLFSRLPETTATSITIDATGNIYLADFERIFKVPADGGGVVTEGADPVSPSPFYAKVAVTPSGTLFATDYAATALYQINQGAYSISSSLPQGLRFEAYSGIISGRPVVASPAKDYLIATHNDAGNSSATVNIQVLSNNALLSALVLKIGQDISTYDPNNPALNNHDVKYEITSVALTPIAQNPRATIKINGVDFASDSAPDTIPLVVGKNVVTITVTAQDGVTTHAYTITFTRNLPTNNYLSQLELSRGALSPRFNNLINTYSTTVSYAIDSITITPTARDTASTLTVNGTAVVSGMASAAISLAVGPNTVDVVVTTAGKPTNKYTVTVTRAPSPDTFLSSLVISRGVLSPKFSHLINNYTTNVSYAVTSVTITPTTSNPGSTIMVNGTALTSGAASADIPLAVGTNTITIAVTALDGSMSTYTVAVMRGASPDTFLASLVISRGLLDPVFSHLITNYHTEVSYVSTYVTITPTTVNPGSTIMVNGSAVPSGTASAPIPLAFGDNAIIIVVTAPDGITTLTYTVTVTRPNDYLGSASELVSVEKQLDSPGLAVDNVNVHEGISPNGDGINDFLVIENIVNYPDNKLQIMNRSGQLIFEAKNYDNSSNVFDGHSNKNGAMQLPGTYFYSLDYTAHGVVKHKTGFIVLKY